MEVQPREIQRYITSDGRVPVTEWLDSMRDLKARVRIELRIDRASQGNLGDYRSVGEGVFEFRIDYGPGYRVYFGQSGLSIILILCGGDKSTQNRDINKAKEYWADYEKRKDTSE